MRDRSLGKIESSSLLLFGSLECTKLKINDKKTLGRGLLFDIITLKDFINLALL